MQQLHIRNCLSLYIIRLKSNSNLNSLYYLPQNILFKILLCWIITIQTIHCIQLIATQSSVKLFYGVIYHGISNLILHFTNIRLLIHNNDLLSLQTRRETICSIYHSLIMVFTFVLVFEAIYFKHAYKNTIYITKKLFYANEKYE